MGLYEAVKLMADKATKYKMCPYECTTGGKKIDNYRDYMLCKYGFFNQRFQHAITGDVLDWIDAVEGKE